jgi:acyl carrier protein
MADTLATLTTVFRDVFDDEALVLTRATTASEVSGWDSVMHVSLMIATERACGVKFRSGDVAGLKNVGELVDLVDRMKAR